MFEELLVKPVSRCSVGKLLDGLPEDSRSNLAQALALPVETVPSSRIRAAIKAELGQGFTPRVISEHRKGTCLCSTV